MRPQWDANLHIAHLPSPERIAEAWERYPHAAGALIVSPTPYGTCADIKAIAEICHDHNKPQIVDEAWGAHLPFCEQLPTWAMDADADICVVSAHKMGAGFEQSSVFHLQGDRIDFPDVAARADLLMTTSPNVLRTRRSTAGDDRWSSAGPRRSDATLSSLNDSAARVSVTPAETEARNFPGRG